MNIIYLGIGVLAAGLLSGCKDDKGPPPPPATYTVGGTVAGLTGAVTLANNGADTRVVNANGAFTFATALNAGAAYNVTITSQPTGQTCAVTSGGGNVASANVTGVQVTCTTNTYAVGGSVSGLLGSGLTLQNNGGDNLSRAADGVFTFATAIAHGSSYNVTVLTQPTSPVQNCTVTNAAGTATAAVTNISISCVATGNGVSQTIGPAGGTLTHPDGAEVQIPAGALTQPTQIGIERVTSGWPVFDVEDVPMEGPVYAFTPHDLQFRKPVIMLLPAADGNETVFVASGDTGWSLAEISRVGNRVALERNTFSYLNPSNYSCQAPLNDPYPCRGPGITGWAAATPANSLLLVSGAKGSPVTMPWPLDSAGYWHIDGNALTTLSLNMTFSAAPDCADARVLVRRRTNLNPLGILIADTPVAFANGRGSASVTVPRADLSEGGNVYSLSFGCRRPHWSRIDYSTDYIGFDVLNGPTQGFTVGGQVSGLVGNGLVLQLGARDTLAVPAGSTSFTFGTRIVAGAGYLVRVHTQPQGAVCTPSNHTGTAMADVTNILVSCTPTGQPAPPAWAVIANQNAGTATLASRLTGSTVLSMRSTIAAGNTPAAVVIAPNGVFTYVANLAGDSLSAYTIQRGSNPVLQNLSGVHTIATPTPSALAADGRYLWVTNHGQSTVSAFVVNDESGELTPAGTPVASGGTSPAAIAVHPNHNRLYVVNEASNSIQMFGIDTASGELTPMGSPLASAVTSGKAMLVAPSGTFGFALSASGSLTRLAVSATSGALSIDGVTSIPGASACYNMTLHPNSLMLYVACSGASGSSVHTLAVDANGALTLGSSAPVGTPGVVGVAIEPSGAWLHAVHQASDSVTTFSVDGGGGLTFSNTASTGDGPVAIAIAP